MTTAYFKFGFCKVIMLLFYALSFKNSVFANTDSLLTVLNNAKSDSARVEEWIQLNNSRSVADDNSKFFLDENGAVYLNFSEPTQHVLIKSPEKIFSSAIEDARSIVQELLSDDANLYPFDLYKENKSDKTKIWVRLIVINKTPKKFKHQFKVNALSFLNIYRFQKDSLKLVLKGGVFQNKNGKINPEYYEIVELELDSGSNVFVFELKNSLFHTSQLKLSNNINETYLKRSINNKIQIAFFSILIFQMIFIFIQWIYIKKSEYIYYLLYLALIGLYFLSKSEYEMEMDLIFTRNPALSIYLDHFLCWTAAGVYYMFARNFVNLQKHDKFLDTIVKIVICVILLYSILELLYILFTQNISSAESVFLIFSSVMTIVNLGIIFSFFRMRLVLFNFAIVGSLLISLGSFVTILLYQKYNSNLANSPIHPISAFQITVVLELLCFTTGLAYKSRLDAREKIESQDMIIQQMLLNENLLKTNQGIRTNISREIHDDLGSQLSTVHYMLSQLNKETAVNSKKILSSSVSILKNAIGEMRGMMDSLQNNTLNNRGLLAAIEELVNKLSASELIRFELHSHGVKERLNHEIEHHLFRIVQELLNNTLKYSEAKRIGISLNRQNNLVVFMYEDDGKGFIIDNVALGNGIKNIKQRVLLLQGFVEFDSTPMKGMRVNISVPA